MNENDELMLDDTGNLSWSIESGKFGVCIGQVEEEYVDVVQDTLKELKRLREENRSVLLRLYELQGQLNTIHRGEQE